MVLLWPFHSFTNSWVWTKSSAKADVSYHEDLSFSSDESCNNSICESGSSTPNCSMSFEEMLTHSIPKPPWHGDGYCSSPVHLTPSSHFEQTNISPQMHSDKERITLPFHTSSPEHERYTPPSERRRGPLFHEEGFVTKNVVEPRNLLEVFEDAANSPDW